MRKWHSPALPRKPGLLIEMRVVIYFIYTCSVKLSRNYCLFLFNIYFLYALFIRQTCRWITRPVFFSPFIIFPSDMPLEKQSFVHIITSIFSFFFTKTVSNTFYLSMTLPRWVTICVSHTSARANTHKRQIKSSFVYSVCTSDSQFHSSRAPNEFRRWILSRKINIINPYSLTFAY